MKLASSDFTNGEEIPLEFTCDGDNISPELHWDDAPTETKGFALTVRDPDAPSGTFDHWLVCNIPASAASIQAGGRLPGDAKEIENDFGDADYGGPCPPSGVHRYVFTLYALKVESIECSTAEELFAQIEEHKISEAELIGKYERK